MKEVLLEAEPREITTRNAINALRASGKITAEFYGHNEKKPAPRRGCQAF